MTNKDKNPLHGSQFSNVNGADMLISTVSLYNIYIFKLPDYADVCAGGNLYMQEPIYDD